MLEIIVNAAGCIHNPPILYALYRGKVKFRSNHHYFTAMSILSAGNYCRKQASRTLNSMSAFS